MQSCPGTCDGWQPREFAGKGWPRKKAIPYVVAEYFHIEPLTQAVIQENVVVGDELESPPSPNPFRSSSTFLMPSA